MVWLGRMIVAPWLNNGGGSVVEVGWVASLLEARDICSPFIIILAFQTQFVNIISFIKQCLYFHIAN